MRLGRAGPSRADAGTGPRPLRDAPQPRRWLLAAGTRALEPLPQQLRNTGARLRAVLSRAGRVVIPGCPQQRRTSHWGALFWGKKKKKKTDLKKLFSWRNPCRLELRPAAHPRPAECRRPQRALRPRPQRLQRSLPRAKPVLPAPPRPAAQPALRVLCEGPLRCSLPLQQTAGVKCSEVPQFSVNVGSGGVRLR